MKKCLNHLLLIGLLLLPSAAFAWHWHDLWRTPDQQGAQLLKKGKAHEASQVFKNKDWQAVSLYRAGDYSQAFQKFNARKTSDDQYNAGNAAAYQEHYDDALKAYEKAIAKNPDNKDAIANREIIKKLKEQKPPPQDKSSADNKKEKNKEESGKGSTSADNKDNAKDKSGKSSTSADNKDNSKDNAGNDSASANNKSDNNDGAKQNNEEQNAKNNSQPPKSPDQSPGQTEQAASSTTKPDSQPATGDAQKESATAGSGLQTADEDNKQMLRRLADDPGGLLRQKFLRDYMRRHQGETNQEQGDSDGQQ
jgi:Ca-activated chloride channel family protein